jgi:hypothetical protein
LVRDHLIRRHGGFFRPQAMGYTTDIAQAGFFTKEEAEGYLDVEGVTIHPLSEYADKLDADIRRREADLFVLRAVRARINATVSS